MKLKIPAAAKVFGKDKKLPKKPSLEKIVMEWLNTEVHSAIMKAELNLSTKVVIGRVVVHVPFDGCTYHPNEFKLLVKSHLVPIGYDVEFTYDGTGMGSDICIITWEHTL
jgi:hypothetical protein